MDLLENSSIFGEESHFRPNTVVPPSPDIAQHDSPTMLENIPEFSAHDTKKQMNKTTVGGFQLKPTTRAFITDDSKLGRTYTKGSEVQKMMSKGTGSKMGSSLILDEMTTEGPSQRKEYNMTTPNTVRNALMATKVRDANFTPGKFWEHSSPRSLMSKTQHAGFKIDANRSST